MTMKFSRTRRSWQTEVSGGTIDVLYLAAIIVQLSTWLLSLFVRHTELLCRIMIHFEGRMAVFLFSPTVTSANEDNLFRTIVFACVTETLFIL